MIFARRRKRSPDEPDIELAHFVTDASGVERDTEAETDRRAFIGRGRTIADPAAFDRGARLGGSARLRARSGHVAAPPACACPPTRRSRLTFWTVVGANRDEIEAAMARLDHPESFARQAMLSWTRSQVQTRHMG